MLFKRKVFFKEIDSTSDYLIRLDNEICLEEGFVTISEFQKNGRGRFGKSWQSNSGENLLFSFILKPMFLPVKNQFYLSMISSIAMVETLKIYLKEKINIKWPNDILINEKKIAGFLLDLSVSSKCINRCVIGCGINVNQKKFHLLNDVTSMALIENSTIDTKVILNQFLDIFSNLYRKLENGDFQGLKNKYLLFAKDFKFNALINNKKSEVQIIDFLEGEGVVALVNGVEQILKNVFTDV